MKKFIATMVLMFGFSSLVFANAPPDSDTNYGGFERVDRISTLHGIYSWNKVDDDSIIVWVTPFRPYLVNLARTSRDLGFTDTIALTSTAGQIHEKFDSVIVHGIRYPIADIFKLDRAAANSMRKNS